MNEVAIVALLIFYRIMSVYILLVVAIEATVRSIRDLNKQKSKIAFLSS